MLVRGEVYKWSSISELLLLYAARKDHVDNLILPELIKNKWVLCDRFSDSTYVYQGMCGMTPIDTIKKVEKLVIGNFKPKITFLIDIEPAIGIKRSLKGKKKETKYEELSIKFHKKVRKAFKKLSKSYESIIFVISDTASVSGR